MNDNAIIAAQTERIANLMRDKDALVRRNIELSLTVQVLEQELLAITAVRHGTDAAKQVRVH